MRPAIGRDETVATEVIVAWRSRRAEVAAICPKSFLKPARLFVMRSGERLLRRAQALVDPIPNEAALQIGLLVNLAPVGPKISAAIAHGVFVFAHDERTRLRFRCVFTQHAWIGIHGANDIGIGLGFGAFVLHGPARIALVDPSRSR